MKLLNNEFKNKNVKVTKRPHSAEEIQAEIDRLVQELKQVKIEEKTNTYNGNFPTSLFAWDMYLDEDEKGTWCSAEKYNFTWDGKVFETEDEAFKTAYELLNELSNENELRGDPNDYTIDIFMIPITELTVDFLEECDLDHIIPAIIK